VSAGHYAGKEDAHKWEAWNLNSAEDRALPFSFRGRGPLPKQNAKAAMLAALQETKVDDTA
jgi:hypothetical protein